MIEITFDNFYSFDSKTRKKYINDLDILKNMIKQNVSEHRYLHSLSVADTCKSLAIKHKVNPDKAYLAGLLHDCCKFPDSDKSGVLEEYLKYYDPNKLNGVYGAYHSWVGKYYLKEKLNFHDKEILNAIYNHTIIDSRDKLSLILYLADKREPSRMINDNILKIAETDLMGAYNQLVEDVEKYVKEHDGEFIRYSV